MEVRHYLGPLGGVGQGWMSARVAQAREAAEAAQAWEAAEAARLKRKGQGCRVEAHIQEKRVHAHLRLLGGGHGEGIWYEFVMRRRDSVEHEVLRSSDRCIRPGPVYKGGL